MSCSIRRPPPASIGRSGSGSNADHPVPRRSPPRSVGSHARQRDSEDAPLSRSVPGRAEPIPAYRDQPGRATQAGTARSGARGPPYSPLQPPHRGSLRRVDPTLRPLPPQAPPRGDGGGRNHSLLELAGGPREGGRLHPEPGAQRPAVPLPRRLELDLPWLDGGVRAKRPQRLPVVLTRDEVRAVLQPLKGMPRLMAYLLYSRTGTTSVPFRSCWGTATRARPRSTRTS